MTRRRKLLVAVGLTVLLGGLTDQVLHRVFMADGKLLGRRVAPFDPPIFYANQEGAFARLRSSLENGDTTELGPFFDAELGWCSPRSQGHAGKSFNAWGARSGPAPIEKARTPGVRRIVAMGCSFTLGHEVEDTETWPYLLDDEVEAIEVINLGVNAYGLDQCWLRYQRDGRPADADEVWLGWVPSVSLRLGSVYRPAASHWSGPILFKPRYRVRAGELELIANPVRSLAEVYHLLTSQAEFLQVTDNDDLWVRRARTAYAPMGSSWLHRTGLGRAWLAYRENGGRDPAALLENEASEIRALVLRIVTAFRSDVERDGSRFRLLVLPGRSTLRAHRDSGFGYWDGVAEQLSASGTEVIDLTDACLAAGMLDDPSAWQTGAHYSAKGNGIIAAALKQAIR